MKHRHRIAAPVTLFLAALLFFGCALSRVEQGRHREGKLQLEQVLHRTAAACYAAEGFYPPSIAYMEAHYGLRYDKQIYTVRYERFASNLMPDITVLSN